MEYTSRADIKQMQPVDRKQRTYLEWPIPVDIYSLNHDNIPYYYA